MSCDQPEVIGGERPFSRVSGVFYRAVDPLYRADAINGSRSHGRYSTALQPTLYLSSSPEGVEAAMVAHKGARAAALDILSVQVKADRIVDLRDPLSRDAVGIAMEDAMAPWQDVVAAGGEPPSWTIRASLEASGAQGLIDPSRKAPGLWHLVLFSWNIDDAPEVSIIS